MNVPGLINKQGTRSRGGQRTVPHTAFMGEEPLTVSAPMTRAQQDNALKERVLEYMRNNLEYDGQWIILYQDSDPVYYDEDGPWTLDAQTVVENADGRVQTTTVLDRELGATPLLPADMFMPHHLCAEALKDSNGDCVAVQLAALLDMPLEQVHNEIEKAMASVCRPRAGVLANRRRRLSPRGRICDESGHELLCALEG